MNTHSETFTPLVCSVIDDALLKATGMSSIPWCQSVHVMNFSEEDPLLNFYANFVVQWVQIWVLEPQIWWNKCECLPFQKSEVGDTDTEDVRTLSWHIVLLEDKELTTDLTHDRQFTVESEVCHSNMCQTILITLSKKWMNFDVIFCNSCSSKMIKFAF